MGAGEERALNRDGVLELSKLVEQLRSGFNSSRPPALQEKDVAAAFHAALLFVNNISDDLRGKNILTSAGWMHMCDRQIAAAVKESVAIDRLVRRVITPDFIRSLFDAVAIQKSLNRGISARER